MIKPRKLQPGDRIAAITLSWGGPGKFPHRYEAGKRQLQDEFDVQVVEMPHTLSDPAWLVHNPRARADDLMQAFADPTIQGIFSTIGGDDSIRILPYLDLRVLRDNPKVFLGFSDTTITHLACFRAGLVSFYGPSIMTGFAENGGLMPYMVDSVRKTLFSTHPPGVVQSNRGGWTGTPLHWDNPENQARRRRLHRSAAWKWLQGTGIRRGHLLGGCMVVLDWLRGTDFWPAPEQWQDAILFLETDEDAPSPDVVRYVLRTYAALGILPRLSGILFGRPGGRIAPARHAAYDQALLDIVAREEGLTELPIVAGMDFGHTDPVGVLPYGVQVEIDCTAQHFSILESAVVD